MEKKKKIYIKVWSTHGVNVMVDQTAAYSFIICTRIQNIIRHNTSSNCICCKVPISE